MSFVHHTDVPAGSRLTDLPDPEVSTLSTLTNVQNSLFVPDLGSLLNRTPTYTLSPRGPESSDSDEGLEDAKRDTTMDENLTRQREPSMQQIRAVRSLSSVLGEERYAVLPDGATLEGWTEEEIQELNDHVRHMLHSRRSKFKRAMKGFGQYVRKRKPPCCVRAFIETEKCSARVLCDCICALDHHIWTCLGSLFDRLVLLTRPFS